MPYPQGGTSVFRGVLMLVIKILKYPKSTDFRPKKKHPYFFKTLTFSSKKTPLFFIKTHWMNGTHILTFEVKILCLFSGSRHGSPVTSGVSRRQSRRHFVDCKGIFTPHTSYLGTKKYPSFTKLRYISRYKKFARSQFFSFSRVLYFAS